MDNNAVSKLYYRYQSNHSKLTRESISKETEKAQLTLRKERLNDLIASKRQLPRIEETDKDSYRIKINELQLPSVYEINLNKYYQNFNLDFLKNYFYSDNIILQKYAISILLPYISKDNNVDRIAAQLDFELLSHFSKYLLVQDKEFQYESSWVLINLFSDKLTCQLFGVNQDCLNNVMHFIVNSINDSVLITMGLWLIRNLIVDSVEAQMYFLNQRLLELFPIIINKYPFNDQNVEYIILIIKNLSSISVNVNEHLEQFMELIPTLTNKLSTIMPIHSVSRIVLILYQLSLNEEAIDTLLNQKVHLILMKTIEDIPSNNNKNNSNSLNNNNKEADYIKHIVTYTLKILGNLVSGTDVQTQRVINDNGIPFLNHYLDDPSYYIVFNALWALSNIATGTLSQIIQLYKSNSLLKTIQIGIEVYKEICLSSNKTSNIQLNVFKEVLNVISFCIKGSTHDCLLPWLSYNNCIVIKLLCQGLSLYAKDADMTQTLLAALIKIVRIDKSSTNIEMNDEIYIQTLVANNIEEKLKVLQNSCNADVSNLADAVYDEMFNNGDGLLF